MVSETLTGQRGGVGREEMARSDPQPARGLPEVLVAVSIASALQEGWENANIDAGFGIHLEIPLRLCDGQRASPQSSIAG
jgi:hypothetical protein